MVCCPVAVGHELALSVSRWCPPVAAAVSDYSQPDHDCVGDQADGTGSSQANSHRVFVMDGALADCDCPLEPRWQQQ